MADQPVGDDCRHRGGSGAKARGKFYGVWQTIGTIGAPGGTSMFAVLSGGLGYWAAFGFLGVIAGGTALILGTQVHERLREKPATTVTW